MKIVSNDTEATVKQFIDLMTGLAQPTPINNGLFDASIIDEAHVLGDVYRVAKFKKPLTVKSADAESDPISQILIKSDLPMRPSVGAVLPAGLESAICHMKCGRKAVNWRTLARFLDGWRFNGTAAESLIPVASAEEVICDCPYTADSEYCKGWAIKLQTPLKLMCAGRVLRSIDQIFVVTTDEMDDKHPHRERDSDYIIGECLTYHIRYLRGFSLAANRSEGLTDCFGGPKAKDQLWYGPDIVKFHVELYFGSEIEMALSVGGCAYLPDGQSKKLLDRMTKRAGVQAQTIEDLLASFFQTNHN